MAEDEIRREIGEYLERHNVGTIAVADGDNPGAHTVYYVSRGLRVCFETDQGSQKIAVLQANPKVSLAVDEDYKDWRDIKGVQLFGKARVLSVGKSDAWKEAYLRKFPQVRDYGGIPSHHVFVEIIPEKVYFLDFTKKFGHKTVHYPDDDGGSSDGKGALGW
jgi:uncharacterized protein YhbP (UPF0306 family)